jgi:hypothetical protein
MTIILTILIIILIFVLLFLNKTESFGFESDDIYSPAQYAFYKDLNERINILTK